MFQIFHLCSLVLLLCTASFSSVNDEYLKVYEARLKMAGSELTRVRADVDFYASQQLRLEKLLGKGAVTTEEYERTVADYKKAAALETLALALVDEKRAELAIVSHKILSGEAISTCR